MSAAASCPWCGAVLADPRPAMCPTCQAVLIPRRGPGDDASAPATTTATPSPSQPQPAGGAPPAASGPATPLALTDEPIVPGVTVPHTPEAILRATDPLLAEALRTSPFRADEAEKGVEPPSDEVRRLIRQMELDRLAAELKEREEIAPPVVEASAGPIADGVPEAPVGPDSEADDPPRPPVSARPAGAPDAQVAPPPQPPTAPPTGTPGADPDTWSPPDPTGSAPQRTRQPAPGPSFVREEVVTLRASDGGERRVTLGMSAPSVMDDGWWLTHLWAADADGVVVDALAVAPVAGPPPTPPLLILGPAFAGALSGLLAQEDGRQLIRFRLPPADDERRPWERPLLVWLAVKWDAVRSSVMRPNELAREVLRAFAQAIQAASKPG